MTRDEAIAILDLKREEAIVRILALAEKADKYDRLMGQVGPTTPSGMTPVYLKPPHKKRKKPPGRRKGHSGMARQRPTRIDRYEEHALDHCPECQTPLGESVDTYQRYIEDLPPVQPTVTGHTIHRYWCPRCEKIVSPSVTEALPNAMIGLRLVIFTAWLHYLVGVSVGNIVKTVSVFSSFKITPGGLTQAWKNLASLLVPLYDEIGRKVSQSAVLAADETGWRLNGLTFYLKSNGGSFCVSEILGKGCQVESSQELEECYRQEGEVNLSFPFLQQMEAAPALLGKKAAEFRVYYRDDLTRSTVFLDKIIERRKEERSNNLKDLLGKAVKQYSGYVRNPSAIFLLG